MKFATKRDRLNDYQERSKIYLLRFGRRDLAPEGQERWFLTIP